MIQKFVDRFMENKKKLENIFLEKHPESYYEIVKSVITIIGEDDGEEGPQPDRIHEIRYGEYQGVLLFVIAEAGDSPYEFWAVRMNYGSCSVCDTLQSIRDSFDTEKPNKEQVQDYMKLALHIVQELVRIVYFDEKKIFGIRIVPGRLQTK